MNYRIFVPKDQTLFAQALFDPQQLRWPEDYRPVGECKAPDPEAAFRALQHGEPECQMPPGEASFSVGSVLEHDGTALRCLGAGWETLEES